MDSIKSAFGLLWAYTNFHTLMGILIVAVALYFIFKTKRKKFKFIGLGEDDEDIDDTLNTLRKKSVKKKQKKFNKHETRCREIFQDIFHEKFKSIRPDFLKNPVTKSNLELDGFCANIRTPIGIGLAFEYDGRQHSEYSRFFHRNGPNEFIYQVKKDSFKDLKCKEKGIMLIRIPHIVAYHDLERYIKTKLRKHQVI